MSHPVTNKLQNAKPQYIPTIEQLATYTGYNRDHPHLSAILNINDGDIDANQFKFTLAGRISTLEKKVEQLTASLNASRAYGLNEQVGGKKTRASKKK